MNYYSYYLLHHHTVDENSQAIHRTNKSVPPSPFSQNRIRLLHTVIPTWVLYSFKCSLHEGKHISNLAEAPFFEGRTICTMNRGPEYNKYSTRLLGSELGDSEKAQGDQKMTEEKNILTPEFPTSKSEPIKIRFGISRTNSETQLEEDEHAADRRDYWMYVRIVSAMSKSRSPAMDPSLANIIRTRHSSDRNETDSSLARTPVVDHQSSQNHLPDLAFKAVHFESDGIHPFPRHLPLTPNPSYYYPAISSSKNESLVNTQDVESEDIFALDL